jgi:hypothetical protein
VDRQTEERIASNDALFRELNERVRASAKSIGIESGDVPFICECADRTCTAVVVLDLDRYAALRENPRRFLTAPGHERLDEGTAVVVEKHTGYVVVEKTGHAGEVAEQLDSAGRGNLA